MGHAGPKKLGVDVPTAMDMASKGLIDGTTGVNAILEGLGTKFNGSMEKQSQTLLGMWSTAKDNVNGILWALGDEIIKTFDLKDKRKRSIFRCIEKTKTRVQLS